LISLNEKYVDTYQYRSMQIMVRRHAASEIELPTIVIISKNGSSSLDLLEAYKTLLEIFRSQS